ncbi:hypothetical protein ACSSS7_000789 [Eimeria intestinalis]
MLPASVPVPDASDAALELAALDLLSRQAEVPELPAHAPSPESDSSPNKKERRRGSGARMLHALSRPLRSPAHYFQRLHHEFGGPLLLYLASNYLFLKGAAYHMALAASTPVFREVLKLEAEQHSVATALFMIPWSIKGIVGSFSDLFAFCGYHKRSYMVLASLLGIIGSSLLIGFARSLTMGMAVAGFFLIMMQASCNDLLCEGTFTRRMAEKPYTGAALTSYVWLCSSFGTFLQAVWVGPVVDHLPFQVVLMPFLPLCLQQFFLLIWPWPFKSWSTHSGIVGEIYMQPGERFRAFFAFVGVALFQRFVSKWTFRRAFLVTSLLQQATCVFDLIMVMRWNLAIGIPDRVWYFFSASIIEEVASMWAFMPGCVLISRLCPKNLESTMYAVVAGLQNFAQSMSKFAGNFLCFTLLGMRTLPTAEGGCNFDKLPLAIGISSGVCPLFPILLTLWLIPKLLMDQPFDFPTRIPKDREGEAEAAAAAAAEAAAAAAAAPPPPDAAVSAPAAPAAEAAEAAEAEAELEGVVGDHSSTPAGSAFEQQKSASSASAFGFASTKESPETSDREGLPSGSSSAELDPPNTTMGDAQASA